VLGWQPRLSDARWPVERAAPLAERRPICNGVASRQVMCRPQEHALEPTNIRPGCKR
jgi:hypothetical protein